MQLCASSYFSFVASNLEEGMIVSYPQTFGCILVKQNIEGISCV